MPVTDKHKVVIIGPAYPYRGGQTIVEANVYNSLTQAGYDCHTISFSLLYPKMFFPGTTQFDQSANIQYPHTERTYRIINSINPFSWITAYRKIKQLKAHTVIFIWWMPFFGPCYSTICWLLKRFSRTKTLFLIENFISHEKRWFDLFMTRCTLKFSDGFITHSKHIKDEASSFFPNKKIEYTTLPAFDFFDLQRYSQSESRDLLGINQKKVVLFFGLIRKYKGLDQLIRAFKILTQEDDDIMLLAVGECYEDISFYEKIIEENGLKTKIKLVNKFIANEDVEPYFKAADLVCLPYYHGTQSGILMMAYGFRKPVIVTNVGGVAELVSNDKTGQVIEDNEPKKIAAAIQKVMEQRSSVDYDKNISSLAETLGYKGFADLFKDLIRGN